jgi:uncharacterized LabA/DUF88 family protein
MQPRFAVLIDAENVPSKHWPHIRQKVEAMGATMIACRIFGDFTNGRLAKWIKLAQAESLQTVLQLSGPNACDIAITIAAMDFLQSAKLEGICLVSSDHDFTPLAQRLKSAGLKVHGFGEAKTKPALRNACTSFTELGTMKPVAVAKAA